MNPSQSQPHKKPTAASYETPAVWGFATRVHANGRVRLKLLWTRILLLLCALLVLFWGTKTVGIYYFYKNLRDFDQITVTQSILFPFNYKNIRTSIGDYHIDRAYQLAENGDFKKAYHYVRNGVSRSPQNLKGRLLLAQFYGSFNPELSLRLLKEGIPFAANDSKYLIQVTRIALKEKDYSSVIDIANRALINLNPDKNTVNQLALLSAWANCYQGNFAQSEKIIAEYEIATTIEGVILRAQILWMRNQKKECIAILDNYVRTHKGKEMEMIFPLLEKYCWRIGDLESSYRWSVEYSISYPHKGSPRINMIRYFQEKKDPKLDKEIDDVINDFARDPDTMAQLSSFASDTGNRELAERVYTIAMQYDFKSPTFEIGLIETSIRAKDFERAIHYSRKLINDQPYWFIQQQGPIYALLSVAYLGAKDEENGQMYFEKYSAIKTTSPEVQLQVANYFKNINRLTLAKKVYERLIEIEPTNDVALTHLLNIDLDLGNSTDLIPLTSSLLELRQPQFHVIQRAYTEISKDRYLFLSKRAPILDELRHQMDALSMSLQTGKQ
jgi:Tfp pilus assembly protein PilF